MKSEANFMIKAYTTVKQFIKTEKRDWLENGKQRYAASALILMFFIFSFVGWLWEVLLHVYYDGMIVNRGMLFGPWLPIYGFGGTFVVCFLRRFSSSPRKVFFLTMLMAGIMEFVTGSVLWHVYQMRWWDYRDSLINIKGFVCLEGLLLFGTGGVLFLYFAAPKLNSLIIRIPRAIRIALCAVLVLLFLADFAFSVFHPNIGFGVTMPR